MVVVCPQVAIGVVGHASRPKLIERLRKQLVPDVVQIDDGSAGCGKNHVHTIERTYAIALDRDLDWLVIVEDDAIPTQDFRTVVGTALEYSPSEIVSLYLGTGYPQQYQADFIEAVNSETCWIMHKWMRHAVGYCLHVSLVPELIDHMKPLVDQRWAPDDAIGEYARKNDIGVAYTNPSLVDHEDDESVVVYRTHKGHPTSGRVKERKAHKFGVPDAWNYEYISV